jgi:phage terminase Nu1 subunit (DNA packaging protein)
LISKKNFGGEISAKDLAELFGISDRSVRELHDRGIVKKSARGRYLLLESVQLYTAHLRGVAAGRGGEGGVIDLTVERARLAKEQADGQALKNAIQRGEMVAATEVERGWTTVCRRIRNAMLAVPSRVRQTLPHLTAYDAGVIDREVRDALSELGTDVDDREADPDGVDQHGAAAETEVIGMD